MFENRIYQVMLKDVQEALTNGLSDADLLRLKDDIRGFALRGDLSDYESSSLLSMLPNISTGTIIEEDPMPQEDNEGSVSQFTELGNMKVDRFYNDDAEKVEVETHELGFDEFGSAELNRFYNSKDKWDDEEEEEYAKPKKETGFGSLFGDE